MNHPSEYELQQLEKLLLMVDTELLKIGDGLNYMTGSPTNNARIWLWENKERVLATARQLIAGAR